MSDLDRAAKLDPKQPQAYLLMAQLNMLPGGSGVKDVATARTRRSRWASTIPRSGPRRWCCAGLQDDKEKKLADFSAAIRLVPNDAATIKARGFALSEMGRLALALADLSRAIELDPEDSLSLGGQGDALARRQRFDANAGHARQVAAANPDSAGPLLQRAKIHCLATADLDAALDDLNRACETDPERPRRC